MLWFLVSALCVGYVWGHAALYEPPGRSSMWRFGFDTPRNDDDVELYCGGITVRKLFKISFPYYVFHLISLLETKFLKRLTR